MTRSESRGFAPSDSAMRGGNTALLFIATGILLIFGLGALFSIDHARGTGWFSKQGVFLLMGLVPLVLFWKIPGEFWRKASSVLYVVNLAMLLAVFVRGVSAGGAQRWLQLGPIQFQPSEFCKIALALTLAAFYYNRMEDIKKPSTFFLSILHLLPPLLLVFKQPHLGGTLTLVAIWFAVTVVAGVPWKFIAVSLVAGVVLIGVAWNLPRVLTTEQKSRVVSFINPDPEEEGYQQTRALVALGSGGAFGSGYLKGNLKANGSVPEQQTDFVFSVIGEEGGLLGVLLLISAYALFFYRCWHCCHNATDHYMSLAGTGVLAALGFHFFANIGMNLMVLPVVGLWLPFISYGGTALWLCLASVGFFAGIK